jgi:3D-(3,5/4)-trihydroxycyclohexane-1,2-dione acylhydrolase (decyclizing)
VKTCEELVTALTECRLHSLTSVIVVETDYHDHVPGYESWWDVPIAEVSDMASVQAAREEYEKVKQKERFLWPFASGK